MSPSWTDGQRKLLRKLIAEVTPENRFYAEKLKGHDIDRLPFTTKAELVADQNAQPPYGSNLTLPIGRYERLCQTSGTTTGVPMRWLDTRENWAWMLGCWRGFFDRAGVTAADRVMFPFSFGPFLGFWTAFEAACQLGCLSLPAGGMSSSARLRYMADHEATVICCTPTYALRLSEVARQEGIDLSASCVGKLIVAGEPGGAIPSTRTRIESAWGARVFDHYGMTEIGPVAVEPLDAPGGLEIDPRRYIVEVIDPETVEPTKAGEVGELVLTNLGRTASPLIRYRTGDLVKAPGKQADGWTRLDGGILGRADDMIHLRGNNVYPSAVEAVIRRFDGVAEFRLTVERHGTLADLRIEVEPGTDADGPGLAKSVAAALQDELLFRAEVVAVPARSLPRFEMKAKRLIKK